MTNERCVKSAVENRLPSNHVNVLARDFGGVSSRFVKVKAIQKGSGDIVVMAVDSTGTRLPDLGRSLRETAVRDWVSQHGKVTPKLKRKLDQSSDPKERYRVGIWLRLERDKAGLHRVDANGDKISSSTAAKRERTAKRRFLDRMSRVQPNPLQKGRFTKVPGAPALIAELTESEISVTSDRQGVGKILSARKASPAAACDLSDTWRSAVNSHWAETEDGIDGDGQIVCNVEDSNPKQTLLPYLRSAGIYCPPSQANCANFENFHPAVVSGVIANTDGTTPSGTADQAQTYFANWGGSGETMAHAVYNGCVANDYTVWNSSIHLSEFQNRYFDYRATRDPFPTITLSSGNHPKCEPEGSGFNADIVSNYAFNTVNVNSSDNHDTTGRADDSIAQSCSTGGKEG